MPRRSRTQNHGLAIRYANRAFVRALGAVLGDSALPATQFLVLRTLWEEDGLNQSELAQRLAMDSPHVTATLDRMARIGLIRRRTDRQDRRRTNVHLTAKARAMKERLVPLLAPANRVAEQGLSRDDIDSLHRVLGRMTQNLEAYLAAIGSPDNGKTRKAAPRAPAARRKA